MKKVNQKLKDGDVFLVPLSDGTFTVGQVLAETKEVLNSVICAYTTQRVDSPEEVQSFDVDSIISVQFTTPDLLKSGVWKILHNQEPVELKQFFDIEELEKNDYVGVNIIGSGVVMEFMDACFGLYPWDGFYRDDFLDGLLLSPDKKPSQVLYEKK